MDDIRGLERVGDTVYVTNFGTANGAPGQGVITFVTSGARIGFFPAENPFDVMAYNGELLVTDIQVENIDRYSLAGAFLVKYSVDRGWLSPAVRVALGLLFGVALLALGEWTRARAGRISQALSAAGVADLYAVLLAGIRLYDLIPPLVGFVLMAANTAVAVLLSLRQGPMIPLIGLVGGFATPAPGATRERNAPGLMAYLFLLDAGLVAVTRRRRWPWLAPGALAASLGWVAGWLVGAFREGDGLALGVFLLASTTLFAGAALRGGEAEGAEIESRRAGWMAAGAAGGALVLLAAVVDAGAYGAVEWGMFALLAGGCYALAWRRDELFGLAPLAAGVALVLLAKRGTEIGAADAPGYLATTAALGLGFAAAAWAALHRRNAKKTEK